MIVNLTPHALHVHTNGVIFTIAPSGPVARVSSERKLAGQVEGISLFRVSYGDVQDLPEPRQKTLFVVSGMVRAALPGRTDLVSPGELIRDAEGRPIGCLGLNVN